MFVRQTGRLTRTPSASETRQPHYQKRAGSGKREGRREGGREGGRGGGREGGKEGGREGGRGGGAKDSEFGHQQFAMLPTPPY